MQLTLEFWSRVIAVRENVNREIENQRNDGVIGSSLNANVTIYSTDSTRSMLKKLGDELKFLTITSGAKLEPLVDNPDDNDKESDKVVVRVEKSEHQKCIRCWHQTADVGSNLSHPEICLRCVENIEGSGEVREFA